MYLHKSQKFSCPASSWKITDTSLCLFIACICHLLLCYMYLYLQKLKAGSSLVQSRQDDYRHKLDGSRPIMEVPQTWPLLPNPTCLGCSVLWTSENRPRSRPIMDVPPTRPLLLQHPTWLQLLTLKWKWQDFIPTHYFANFPQLSAQHCPLLTQEEIGQIYRFQII